MPTYLSSCSPLGEGEALVCPRAEATLKAIGRNRDFKFIRAYKSAHGCEVIECEVTCDGVPNRNQAGIRYTEPLAIEFPCEPNRLPEVFPLREDFPVLPHQNVGSLEKPNSLCLYNEPTTAALRTWTAERFLNRILWWLQGSATGTLHPDDQHVEQLFFVTHHELVLPARLSDVATINEEVLVIEEWRSRDKGGGTGIVRPMAKDAVPNGNVPVLFVPLIAPTLVMGGIEREPLTLGELADSLQRRGYEAISALKEKLVEICGSGKRHGDVPPRIILLFRLPISRTAGGVAEFIQNRGYLLDVDVLTLGEELGALCQLNGQYFKEVANQLGGVSRGNEKWKEHPVQGIEVLHEPSREQARQYSGIQEPGPAALLIGAGALGSALLDMWGRAGWGTWFIIDKDHVRPHNLVRHTAFLPSVGFPKAAVVCGHLHAAIGEDAKPDGSVVRDYLHADASDFEDSAINEAFGHAELAIDASTSVEYARAASANDALPRHASVFLTPNGSGSALLLEDKSRSVRLAGLEAQYYRAVINDSWGATHLTDEAGRFRSGVGCRDISTVMSYSAVLAHASAIADHLRMAHSLESASMRVWSRDAATGELRSADISVHRTYKGNMSGLDVYYDDGLLAKLRALRKKHLPHETGGILVGYHDFNINAVFIVDAFPQPPDSVASEGGFERGVEGVIESVQEAARRTLGMVSYIGEWHSHPRNHSATPSGDDIVQINALAGGMAEEGLPAISLIVGERDIQILQLAQR